MGKFSQRVPWGAKGELVIGGDGVAEGYLNRPDLQEQRFIKFPELSDMELYRSGDKVILRLDPNDLYQIFYEGRIGEEIKKQGYFVFLEGITSCLCQHSMVEQAAVLAKITETGEKVLAAFYIKKKELTSEINFIDHLSANLPHYMIPYSYTELESFPVTRNGKLDKKALLKLESNVLNLHLKEELTTTQLKLVELFKKVLFPTTALSAIPYLGLNANFFFLGGSSIRAIEFIERINLAFGVKITFAMLRFNSTICTLGKVVDEQITVNTLQEESTTQSRAGFPVLLKGISGSASLAIVFIHPAGGTWYCYDGFIRMLPLDYCCFGIEDPVITNGVKNNLSLQEMAADYLGQIQKVIEKPFILVGYSFGGMLSLEIASQAEKGGISTLLGVVLLDTWIVSCADSVIQAKLKKEVLDYYDNATKEAARDSLQLVKNSEL